MKIHLQICYSINNLINDRITENDKLRVQNRILEIFTWVHMVHSRPSWVRPWRCVAGGQPAEGLPHTPAVPIWLPWAHPLNAWQGPDTHPRLRFHHWPDLQREENDPLALSLLYSVCLHVLITNAITMATKQKIKLGPMCRNLCGKEKIKITKPGLLP